MNLVGMSRAIRHRVNLCALQENESFLSMNQDVE